MGQLICYIKSAKEEEYAECHSSLAEEGILHGQRAGYMEHSDGTTRKMTGSQNLYGKSRTHRRSLIHRKPLS
jgi:hypothetical protein